MMPMVIYGKDPSQKCQPPARAAGESDAGSQFGSNPA